MTDLDAIRARHRPAVWESGEPKSMCYYCKQEWRDKGCDAAQLAALLTVERVAAALRGSPIAVRNRSKAADAILAALTDGGAA